MKKLMNILSVLVMLALVLAVFVGCDDSTGTVDYAIGDDLGNGFIVSAVDDLGGYMATRTYDADGDVSGDAGYMTGDDDEYQVLVAGRFGTDMSWDSDNVYYLADAVFIGNDNANNCTLTIEAGTLIKGEVSTTKPGVLVITRGSKINAVGTAAAPIVFTSAKSEGTRARGDWGGLVINGNAAINATGGTAEGEGETGTYGGTDDADNSGTLKYVRVEFAGTLFSADNELNGIAFQAVGSGTTVDYVQVHMNADCTSSNDSDSTYQIS